MDFLNDQVLCHFFSYTVCGEVYFSGSFWKKIECGKDQMKIDKISLCANQEMTNKSSRFDDLNRMTVNKFNETISSGGFHVNYGFG